MVVPRPRWLFWSPVHCLWESWHVAQMGCDHGLHQHVCLRDQSAPGVGRFNVPHVDTAVQSCMQTYMFLAGRVLCGPLHWTVMLSPCNTGQCFHPVHLCVVTAVNESHAQEQK